MTRRLAATACVLLALFEVGCSSGSTPPAETQEKFGVRMARMNLWREARFRFERAVELNPQDATAHSNLAVALEANGDFEGAAKAYREALRLDKSNQYIQKNYSRFVEFTNRDRRRQQRLPAPAADTAEASSETPAPTPVSLPITDPAEGETPKTPAEAADPEDGDPAPTAAAPAATPAPNPAPAPQPVPPGGQS